MTIQISTGDLCGLLKDVIPFAFPNSAADPQYAAVRIEWDGLRLHTMATDRYRLGWAHWEPDDIPDADGPDDLFCEWGGPDPTWHVAIPIAIAKHAAKIYKLPRKRGRVPLQLDVVATDKPNRPNLVITRPAWTGHPEIVTTIEGVDVSDIPHPRRVLALADVVAPVTELVFSPSALADFGSVRNRGEAMEMTTTGPGGLVNISIGARFVGAAQPLRKAGVPAATVAVEQVGESA